MKNEHDNANDIIRGKKEKRVVFFLILEKLVILFIEQEQDKETEGKMNIK